MTEGIYRKKEMPGSMRKKGLHLRHHNENKKEG
jgi:hypothetical protein